MLRLTLSIVFWLTPATQCFAEEALPQLSFLPARLCDPTTTSDQESSAQSSIAAEIEKLIADLPRGRERDVALRLRDAVSVRHLPGFCMDPRNGEFVAESVGGYGTRSREFRVALGNRSLPDIEFDLAAGPEEGTFDYAYRVSNGAEARAPIATWGLMTPVADHTKSLTHPLWPVATATKSDRTVTVATREGTQTGMGPLLDPGGSELVRWKMPSDRFAIQAGSSPSLFAVRSAFRPGWTTAYVGSDDAIELPQQPLPEEVMAGLEVLSRPEHYFTGVLTVGPKFSPGTDRTWIAGDWLFGIQSMTMGGHLSATSPYVTELLDALVRIAASAPEALVPLKVRSPPKGAMEALVDKAVRMALR